MEDPPQFQKSSPGTTSLVFSEASSVFYKQALRWEASSTSAQRWQCHTGLTHSHQLAAQASTLAPPNLETMHQGQLCKAMGHGGEPPHLLPNMLEQAATNCFVESGRRRSRPGRWSTAGPHPLSPPYSAWTVTTCAPVHNSLLIPSLVCTSISLGERNLKGNSTYSGQCTYPCKIYLSATFVS
jgi:hypothetical protein